MPSGLATLVAGIWTEAGYETTISHRDGDTYVLAEHAADGTYDLLWILDDDEVITVAHLDRFRSRIADLSVNDAYVVSPRSVEDAVDRAAAERGVEAVGIETLRSLADQSGVGQVALDAALATTVGPEETVPGSGGRTGADVAESVTGDEGAAGDDPEPIDLHDPQRQAEIRQRLDVMIGEAEPDEEPTVEPRTSEDHGDDEGADPLAGLGDDDADPTEPHDDGDATDDDGVDTTDTDTDEASDDGDATDDGPADPLGGPDLADPSAEETSDDGGGGALKSRRGLITGGVAAVLSAGVLDVAVFNLVLGGGGMPSYNETRVKTEAVAYTPEAILSSPDSFAAQEAPVVFREAVVTAVESGGPATVTFDADGTVVGRWDGAEPTIGTRYTIWGVVTGTTTVEGDDVPTVDIVDMVAGDAASGEGTATTTGGTTTGG